MGRMTSGSSSAGNTRYLAPERVCADENSRRTTASDVYAFACVCLFVSPPLHGGLMPGTDGIFSYTPASTHSTNIPKISPSASKS
jgi:hypothetical protein